MNNTYIIRKKSLFDMLTNIAEFEEKMNKFLSKHKNIQYNLTIDKEDDEWILKINIKDEQTNTKASKETTGSRSVL